jgi:hypothetical protein
MVGFILFTHYICIVKKNTNIKSHYYEMEEIENIYKAAIDDPEVFSQINMDKLMESIENEKNQYLENKKTSDIAQEILDSMEMFNISPNDIAPLCNKLVGYRYVDEIYQLHKGKHVRWIKKADINKKPQLLNRGGIVIDVKFEDKGIYIICCVSNTSYILKYKYDDCLTYQKLSMDEQLILLANNYIQSDP